MTILPLSEATLVIAGLPSSGDPAQIRCVEDEGPFHTKRKAC
jgi:hypothetical protein